MCGEPMRLAQRQSTDTPARDANSPRSRSLREWTCPECDYFEEADGDEE